MVICEVWLAWWPAIRMGNLVSYHVWLETQIVMQEISIIDGKERTLISDAFQNNRAYSHCYLVDDRKECMHDYNQWKWIRRWRVWLLKSMTEAANWLPLLHAMEGSSLPSSEVSGSKQILDWWTVELAQACSRPATIFHLRMSCYATWIFRKNHSRNN